MQIFCAVFSVLLAVNLSLGYKIYQDEIPNGGSVPHPCKPNYIWQGVGHQNVLGGGERNPFGVDFKAAGAKWTKELCQKDSDLDGKTNGEELGDPSCTWSKGSVPAITKGLSHPGVCTPTDSADCQAKNKWEIDCSMGTDFTCDGIDVPEVVNVTLQIKNTSVPAQETTYMCQKFTVPSDKTYHMIATKPAITNPYVMHHIILRGCPGGVAGFDEPTECGMATLNCSVLIGAWTVGANGQCLGDDTGILLGKNNFNTVLMQLHWNNPLEKSEYFDNSGMTLYLTPELRTNSLGMLMVGQVKLDIPGLRDSYTTDGTCTSACSEEKLKDQSVYITSVGIHMHYLGVSGRIEHWRDNELVSKWADAETYSYDTPVRYVQRVPVEFRPGDEIKTVCTFKSTFKNTTTNFGEATSDEMCLGFINYYPSSAGFNTCVARGPYDECKLRKLALPNQNQEDTSDDNNPNSSIRTSYSIASIVFVSIALSLH